MKSRNQPALVAGRRYRGPVDRDEVDASRTEREREPYAGRPLYNGGIEKDQPAETSMH